VGAKALSHDGRPRRSRETKPTTFETLTGGLLRYSNSQSNPHPGLARSLCIICYRMRYSSVSASPYFRDFLDKPPVSIRWPYAARQSMRYRYLSENFHIAWQPPEPPPDSVA
jgi:hypothetical protein